MDRYHGLGAVQKNFGNLFALSKPVYTDDFSAHNFIGSTQTVAERPKRLRDIGLNQITV